MLQHNDDLVFRALADPTRRAMLERLDGGPLAVTALAEPFDVTLTAITQHVRTLERAGLITSEKSGRERICSVDRDGLVRAEQWISTRRQMWERRLDRLDRHLDERHPRPKGTRR
ncbi:MAG: metalloregulator ArsR/SmtB family transcription factor [Actinomycetota bacterium]